jgi:ribose transport system substrate-binding protein
MGLGTSRMLGGMAVLALVVTACGSSDGDGAAAGGTKKCDTAKATAAIQQYARAGDVLAKGPFGEVSPRADSIELMPDEVAEVKAKQATAAIVMHFSGDTWSNAQVTALRSEFQRLGIRVVAQTDAQAQPSKQFSDIETVLARRPDVMASIPSLDPVALAPAYRKAEAAGVKLVFMENPAKGMTPGSDYVSVVATDNYGAGVINAHQMAVALCGKGEVGTIYHAAAAPTNKLRRLGFEDTINKDYPGIKIVERRGLLGPDWKGQGSEAVNAWITKHPDLKGVWCWFDAPCEGAIDAARSAGRNDLLVTSVDLGNNVSIDMAGNRFVKGIAAAQPYQQGIVEARLAAYALIGKEAPPFVSVPVLPVDRSDVLEAWQKVYNVEAPKDITETLEKAQ